MSKATEKIEPIGKVITDNGVRKEITVCIKKKTGKAGKPALILTEDGARYIETLAGYGCTKEEIAFNVGVALNTLTNETNKPLFEDAYSKGKSSFIASIRASQVKIMKKGSSAMAIFLGKNYLGQKDSQEVTAEVSAKVGILTGEQVKDMSLEDMLKIAGEINDTGGQ